MAWLMLWNVRFGGHDPRYRISSLSQKNIRYAGSMAIRNRCWIFQWSRFSSEIRYSQCRNLAVVCGKFSVKLSKLFIVDNPISMEIQMMIGFRYSSNCVILRVCLIVWEKCEFPLCGFLSTQYAWWGKRNQNDNACKKDYALIKERNFFWIHRFKHMTHVWSDGVACSRHVTGCLCWHSLFISILGCELKAWSSFRSKFNLNWTLTALCSPVFFVWSFFVISTFFVHDNLGYIRYFFTSEQVIWKIASKWEKGRRSACAWNDLMISHQLRLSELHLVWDRSGMNLLSSDHRRVSVVYVQISVRTHKEKNKSNFWQMQNIDITIHVYSRFC